MNKFMDDTTGTITSNLFHFLLEYEIRRSLRYQNFTTVLILEPDSKPHASETLQTVVNLISKNIRDTDFIGRMNDTRFGVLLLYTGLDGAYIAGTRILDHINKYNFPDEQSHHLTVSIGGACFPTDSTEMDALFKMAENSFKKAKATGNVIYLPGLSI